MVANFVLFLNILEYQLLVLVMLSIEVLWGLGLKCVPPARIGICLCQVPGDPPHIVPLNEILHKLYVSLVYRFGPQKSVNVRSWLEIWGGKGAFVVVVAFLLFKGPDSRQHHCFSPQQSFTLSDKALTVSPSENAGFTLRCLIWLAIQLRQSLCPLVFTQCPI